MITPQLLYLVSVSDGVSSSKCSLYSLSIADDCGSDCEFTQIHTMHCIIHTHLLYDYAICEYIK